MKKKLWIPLLLVIALAIIATSQYPKLYVATGYGAKCMASGIFVAGREALNIQENDLDYSIVKYTRSIIDFQEKSVTTTLFGLAKQKAIYREGFGCCLVGDDYLEKIEVSHSQSIEQPYYSWKSNWPEGEGMSDTIFPEMDTNQLKNAVGMAFDLPGNKIKRTAAAVVIYKGKLVAEQYWTEQSIGSDTKLWGWSMNKSIVNAMVGIMVKQGKLSLTASAPIEAWLSDKRRDITLNDLLHMSSGLTWNEDYGAISDVTNMLYRQQDVYKYAIDFPLDVRPDSEWKYSSGTTNILSGIIRNTLKSDKLYHTLPYREIFGKIGMKSMVFETDASGNYVGSSYGYATAKDWAKFGQLYLQDGVWKGDSILPKGWVSYTTTPGAAAKEGYGAQFWLNRSGELPDAPLDMYSCKGHRGQRIFILPSRQLVIVRLGFAEDQFNYNPWIKTILMSFSNPK
jgi:CubicO group peptidase (beta-lactamase class C family)